MAEQRRAQRIINRSLTALEVKLDSGGQDFNGRLGNISEKGLCMLVAGSAPIGILPNATVRGTISGDVMQDRLVFKGQARWEDDTDIKSVHYRMLGIEFEKAIDLPDTVLALELADD